MRKIHASKSIWVERIIIIWALLATTAYFVQKVTVDYTFDYSFLARPAFETRYEGLVQMLPALGKAVYIPDPMADPASESTLINELLARYCLAPYLSPDDDSPFRVSDFHHPVGLRQWAQRHHLILIRDFQNGVALFRNKGLP
jgi:hypothetical protein